jgi:peptidoglycan/xylan/chitin deacetylase (PgdA/CDA1 family)
MQQYPELTVRIREAGHEIGIHGFSHRNMAPMSRRDIAAEIADTRALLPEKYPVRLLRPPGGHYDSTTQSICRDYGLSIIMWSLDTLDWDNDKPEPILQAIQDATAGDIILMHDIKENSVDAALEAIDDMTAKGYVFVTVSELSEIMDCPLYGGSVYASM